MDLEVDPRIPEDAVPILLPAGEPVFSRRNDSRNAVCGLASLVGDIDLRILSCSLVSLILSKISLKGIACVSLHMDFISISRS